MAIPFWAAPPHPCEVSLIPVKTWKVVLVKEDVSHRFQRLLRLLSTIQEEPGKSAQELADQFGTSKRNLFRDIKLLQDSGFAIESEGGYSLAGSPAGLPISDSQAVPQQGLHPWEQSSAAPVYMEIKLETTLARILQSQPLHPSQHLRGNTLSVSANPDRMVDWLMSVQGAELLEPSWLRGSVARRAQELLNTYNA